jgi:Protein of unknown function (DUF2752)
MDPRVSQSGSPSAAQLPAWLPLVVLAGACFTPLAAYLLYSFPPEDSFFYPGCALHALTGLHCPGCGTTRALHALLHGDWRQAAAWNVWLLLSLPILIWFGIRLGAAMLTRRCLAHSRALMFTLKWWMIGGLVFALVRNIDVWPCVLLAPHRL